MTDTETTTAGIALEQEAQNTAFAQLCAEKGLLKRPAGLEDQDLCDGLSDLPTLLYASVPRAALF